MGRLVSDRCTAALTPDSIHPSQNLTVLPYNFHDEELDDPTAVPHPLSVYTPINKHIFLFKFAMLYRQITDHMASSQKTSYAFILEYVYG